MLYKETLVDFDYKQIVRHDINKMTFSGYFQKSSNFLVFEYAPYVFEDIRIGCGVDREEYQKSIGPENMLGNLLLGYLDSMTELASEGKSGSLFYLTPDSQFFVKTIRKSEFDVLFIHLKSYHEHLKRNTNSLIYKITGLYSIDTYINGKHRILYVEIMKNVFCDHKPTFTYDLKGSTYKRTAYKDGVQKSKVLRDLDWINHKMHINLSPDSKKMILGCIEKDTRWLRSIGVMDYSLIVGVSSVGAKENSIIQTKKGEEHLHQSTNQSTKPIISRCGRFMYTVSIIDILTSYACLKRLETAFKVLLYGRGVSCVHPKYYSERFYDFCKTKVFE